jgi:hypothetical protein
MESETDVYSLEHLEKRSVEEETAATYVAALKQHSWLGDSGVAGIAKRMQLMIWKDLESSFPERQQ